LETLATLRKNNGPSPADWRWENIHSTEWPNPPWSMTPLKPLWHREVPSGGNSHTPSVSRYIMARFEKDNMKIKSFHTANYKQVI